MSTESINSSLLNLNYARGSLSDLVRQGQTASGSYSGFSSISDVGSAISNLLSEVPNSGGKLTFKDVMEYRDKLQEEFETALKEDLEAIGVDTDVEFTLNYDAASGKVTVDPNHPDKAKIDNYFDQNPDRCDEFAKIVSLSNISNTAENRLRPSQLKQQIQASAMETWWSSDSASSIASGNLLFGASSGLQFFGLDTVV